MSRRSPRLSFRDKVFFGALAFSLLVNVWAVDSLRTEVAALRQAQRSGSVGQVPIGGDDLQPLESTGADPAAGPTSPGATGVRAADVPAATDRTGVSKGTIKIGAVITQSGLADQTPILRGLSAWIQHVNAAGGVNGRKIELIVEDDGTDTSRGSAALRKLVENDKIFALVSECAPLTDAQNVEYLRKKGVPVIGSCVLGGEQFFKNPYQFPLRLTMGSMGRLVGKYVAQDMAAVKPAVIQLDHELLIEMGDGVVAQWKKMGVKDYTVETAPVVNPNFTPTVIRMRGEGVDNVSLLLDTASTIRFLQAASQQGWNPKLVGVVGYDEEVIRYGGAQVEGMMVPFYSQPVRGSYPIMKQFREDMQRYYPGEQRLELANNGYHPAWVFTDVLAKLGDNVTRRRLIDAMDGLTNYDDHVIPPYTLRPGNHETVRACKWAVIKDARAQVVSTDWYYLER
ncbi:MAG: ABC transporter substrate-binding protein [Actinomycetota bacterium]